jgi:membrane associated rhomboid family serine protease
MIGMVTSTFSHKSFVHFMVSMAAFNLLATPLLYRMSANEFVPFYFTGGMVSSLAYHLHAVLTRQALGGIGATGYFAIFGSLLMFKVQFTALLRSMPCRIPSLRFSSALRLPWRSAFLWCDFT